MFCFPQTLATRKINTYILAQKRTAMEKDTQQNTSQNNPKRPTQRLLVVSENQELSLYLKSELENNLFEHPLKVDFCYTSFNLNPQQMIEIGA